MFHVEHFFDETLLYLRKKRAPVVQRIERGTPNA